MTKTAEETKALNTNKEVTPSGQYESQLKREQEKAAIVFKKMKHVGHYDYKNFRALWRSCWSEDFKTCNNDKLWLERYQWYLRQWNKWNIKQYDELIKKHREPGIPGDIQKRLSSYHIVAERVERNKKLGGYQLKHRIIDDTGKKKWQTVAGKKYDLSISDIVDILNEMDPENKLSYAPVEKTKVEKSQKPQKPEKKHEPITYDDVNALLQVPDKIAYVEPEKGEVINTVNRSRAIDWKIRLKALSQMSKFKDERVDKRLIQMSKSDKAKYCRNVATRYANLRKLGGKDGFAYPPKYSRLSNSEFMPKIERELIDVAKHFKQQNVIPTFNQIIYEFRKRNENLYLLVEGYVYVPGNPKETQKWFRDKCNTLKINYQTQKQDKSTPIGA